MYGHQRGQTRGVLQNLAQGAGHRRQRQGQPAAGQRVRQRHLQLHEAFRGMLLSLLVAGQWYKVMLVGFRNSCKGRTCFKSPMAMHKYVNVKFYATAFKMPGPCTVTHVIRPSGFLGPASTYSLFEISL